MKKSLVFTFLISFFCVAQAMDIQKITFADLQGKVALYQDPFANLSGDQLYYLSLYTRITDMQKSMPNRVTEVMLSQAESARTHLDKDTIDVEYLIEQRNIIAEKRQQAAMATNPLLADKQIEMTGFMLPLELNGGKITEFLLVPTVGACSHEPVPSANQILLVKTTEPVLPGELYAPVVVTGKLNITAQSKELYLVDGQKGIDMSYRLDGATVMPY